MKRLSIFLISALFLVRCAAYKQLEPKPALNPAEDGYIELRNDKEYFKLKHDKKYFVTFPSPFGSDVFLVLDISSKPIISSYLTKTFKNGKGDIVKIPDQTPDPERLSVYPVDNSVQKFYWVIDTVRQDLDLHMKYRYVARWRFLFEQQYNSFKTSLSENRVDRSPYEQMGEAFSFDGFHFESEISSVQDKHLHLDSLQQSLQKLEDIFPQPVLNSQDSSYQNYLLLKSDVVEEYAFQERYLTVLNLLYADQSTRNNSGALLEYLEDFDAFYQRSEAYPPNVVRTVSDVVSRRFVKFTPWFKNQLKKKRDAKALSFPVQRIATIFKAAGIAEPADFKQLKRFVLAYNDKVSALESSRKKVQAISEEIKSHKKMPNNTYFSGMLTRLSKIRYKLPATSHKAFKPFASYRCVRLLKDEIKTLRNKISGMLDEFRTADNLIPQINALKARKNYHGMLRILKQNNKLSFLKGMYKSVDQLSLKEQTAAVNSAIKTRQWLKAEEALRTLHKDKNFLYPKNILPLKKKRVLALEDTLFNRIAATSLNQARQFTAQNIKTLQNVEELYANPVFLPVHEMTFSARSTQYAQQRNAQLKQKLSQLKEVKFPAQAISELYQSLVQNPADQGVLKARAVVVHGKHYKGADKKIKRRVAECDPWASKWITKPKKYRTVFALPVTTNPGGANEYVFRLNIRIPSEAKFPVYDINIKLPKQIAKKAATKQWYKSITLNKQVIKNEGRFTITAPTAKNGYECQITPVRMRKDADNVLEIHFKNPSFKVFEVSVMAQKPIIKKH